MESGEASEGWGSLGAQLDEQGRDREEEHMAVACGNGGSALSRMGDALTFHRTRGVRRCAQLEVHFWAGSAPN